MDRAGNGNLPWERLSDGVDAADLARHAIADGIVLAPGPVFSITGGSRDYMRFTVAISNDDHLSAFPERARQQPLRRARPSG